MTALLKVLLFIEQILLSWYISGIVVVYISWLGHHCHEKYSLLKLRSNKLVVGPHIQAKTSIYPETCFELNT